MESKKVALLAVAVVAIGIFALPSTVSLFSGQHSWYGLGEYKNEVPCDKCHQDIGDEMTDPNSGAHLHLGCECHRTIFTNYTYASGQGDSSIAGKEAHAASAVECMDCHGISEAGIEHIVYYANLYGGCDNCHATGAIYDDFITAGGFNLTGESWDTGEKAAHKKFVNDSIDDPLMEGANEACIACHTRVGVNISWTKKEYLEFTASEDAEGNWTIPSFAAGGENKTQVNSSNKWTTKNI